MDEKEEITEVTKVVEMPDLVSYMQLVIEQLENARKRPAAHTYTYALRSFTLFWGEGMPIPVDKVFTSGKLKEYEEWMRREGRKRKDGEPKGLSLNSISTYLRNLKAVYNRLVDEKLLPYDSKLFDDVYTKVESQIKCALDTEQMNVLLYTDFEQLPKGLQSPLVHFRLMFLFRGMPFIDLAHLRKQDVIGNYIIYSRHKTGRQMTVRIPQEAAWMMEKFKNTNPGSIYLFPILDGQSSYLSALRNFNRKLEKIAALLLPDVKLSSYTPRHTWATLAFYSGVSVGIICKALGHSSIKVTETYLKPFENERVDAANDELITSVAKCGKKKQVASKIPCNRFGQWLLLTK